MPGQASNTLFRLLVTAFAEAGMGTPSPPKGDAAAGIAIESKRELLARAIAHGGPALVVRAALTIRSAPSDPIADLFRRARSPSDLMRRWGRLESYHHTRHRTRVLEEDPNHVLVEHYSLNDEPPMPVEDLLIAALLAGLLMEAGCSGLSAAFADDVAHPFIRDDKVVAKPPLPGAGGGTNTALWRMAWKTFTPRPLPLPDPGRADMASKVRALVAADLDWRWQVGEVARRLGTSTRSLQRRLTEAGTSLSRIIREVRVAEASKLLAGSPHGLSEIGYGCGFSDQAHFTREFRRLAGVAPGEYRRIERHPPN